MARILSKKELRNVFGVSPESLRTKVFTDDVLAFMGMTVDDYNRVKMFDAQQSAFIMQYFKIEKEELQP